MADGPRKKLGDARKPRVPAQTPPPGGKAPDGALPFMPGTVRLTDFEKSEIRKYAPNWKEGDPIPKELPALYAAVSAARASAETMPEIDPEVAEAHKLQLPPEVKIQDLPKPRQNELAAALASAKIQAEMIKKRQAAQVEGAGPGVNEAISAGLSDPLPSTSVVEDDLTPKVAAPPQFARTGIEPDGEASGAGGAEHPKNCPHCGWLLSRGEVEEPTDEDKLRWLIAQEGAVRFQKDYSLLGGRMIVTFRTLTSKESDTAWRQVAVDGRSDLASQTPETEDHYWRNLMTYRLLMGIARVWTHTNGPQENPVLDEWTAEKADYPGPNTKLLALLGPITESLFPTETLRKQIGNAYHRFGLLVEQLEARAEDDSFWAGIGQPS